MIITNVSGKIIVASNNTQMKKKMHILKVNKIFDAEKFRKIEFKQQK
jgi:polyisoprenoid-binding protein YceI